MVKEPLIIGLDPGITTAYAVLDTKGNLLKLKSSKNLSLNTLISELLKVDGKITAVGSDVKYPPHFVEKFCSAFSAKLICPKEDMKVGLKERMTANIKTNDDHQRDALAAALFAYNELRPVLQKVELRLKEEGKEHRSNDVKELVMQGASIVDALEQIEKKAIAPQIKKRMGQKIKRSKRIFEENTALKGRNASLAKEVEFLKAKVMRLEKARLASIESQAREMILFKDRKIASLQKAREDDHQFITSLKTEVSKHKNALLNLEGKLVIRRWKNLGKELATTLKEKEIIYIDDPSSISQGIMDQLKEKGIRVVSSNKPAKDLDQAGLFIDARDINLRLESNYVIVSKEGLEKKLSERDVLYKIISEYKESRSPGL